MLIAVRKIKKDEEPLVRERIAECVLNDDERNFWLDIKRIGGSKTGASGVVDGFTGYSCIAKLFATTYREIYTSISYDNDEMQDH